MTVFKKGDRVRVVSSPGWYSSADKYVSMYWDEYAIGTEHVVGKDRAYITPDLNVELDDGIVIDAGCLQKIEEEKPVTTRRRPIRINRSVQVESSFIDRLDYSTEAHVLIVRMKSGTSYAYEVRTWRFEELVGSDSVGSYYSKAIKSYCDSIPMETLNVGMFEEPVETVADAFPIGTPVRLIDKSAYFDNGADARIGQVGLISGYFSEAEASQPVGRSSGLVLHVLFADGQVVECVAVRDVERLATE